MLLMYMNVMFRADNQRFISKKTKANFDFCFVLYVISSHIEI